MKTPLPAFSSRCNLAVCLVATLLLFARAGADDKPLHPQLEKLRPLLGKTWRGEFKNSTPEKPVVDIARWERALNGQAIRTLHSINQGQYGGETLIYWSEEKKSVAYHYVTTAGFQTSGTMTFDGGKVIAHEKISGSAGGVTEVKATSEIRDDGTFFIKTEHLKDGQWIPGRETLYREDSKAEVVFK